MQLLIMGAGSIGSVAGGFMAKAGHKVTLIGRDPHMAAIRSHGLRIRGIWGEHHVSSLTALTDTTGLQRGDFDAILVCVKSYDTATVAATLQPLVDDATLVCAYQNGLGNAETLAAALGWERVVGARAIYGTVLPAPGEAEVTVIANPTAIGPYLDKPGAEALVKPSQALAEAMNDAGLPTVFTGCIATVLWAKVAYNCALNPLSALLDVPYGALAASEDTRAIMHEVITELYAVAGALGVPLDPATAEAYEEVFYTKLVPPTAAHYASMREDFKRGRRTEIDALNGAIARYGNQCGLACPSNSLLTRLVQARERHGLRTE